MPAKPASFAACQASQRLGQRAALVGLQQHGIGGTAQRGLAHARGLRDQEIVADHLHALADLAGERSEPVGIVLGQRILDRDDRIARDPAGQQA